MNKKKFGLVWINGSKVMEGGEQSVFPWAENLSNRPDEVGLSPPKKQSLLLRAKI